MQHTSRAGKALRAAFPYTVPILAGFCFLGLTYGVYMKTNGFSFLYPALMSLLIFAGSMEFVTAGLLIEAFDPLNAFFMALMVNGRHIFYGISILERYRAKGWKTPYLIFGMCDESFSINLMANIPEDVDAGWFMFFVTLLNHLYWFVASTLGGLLGSLVHFNTQGLEFVMTALFATIFLEQWLKEPSHVSSCIGVLLSVLCLALLGPQRFIIPAMLAILCVLTLLRGRLEKGGAVQK